jgi:hypothetical protein
LRRGSAFANGISGLQKLRHHHLIQRQGLDRLPEVSIAAMWSHLPFDISMNSMPST